MKLLRILSNELIIENNIQIKADYHEIKNDNKNKYEVIKEYNEFFNHREHSFVHDLFNFQTITTYICRCKYKSFTCENLLEIPIIIPKEKVNLDLNILIENYFQKSEIPLN